MISAAAFKIDDKKLAAHINGICEETKSATVEELQQLHQSGYIPTGVLEFILSVRRAGL